MKPLFPRAAADKSYLLNARVVIAPSLGVRRNYNLSARNYNLSARLVANTSVIATTRYNQ